MANSDIQQMLGLISQKENKRRHKVAKRKKKYRESHPVSSSTGGSGSSKSSSGSSSHKSSSHKKKDYDVSIFHPSTLLRSFNEDFLEPVGASPVGKGLGWTLDKISRTGYGASAAAKSLQDYEYSQDRDHPDDRNQLEKVLDDITHPSIYKKAAHEFGEGFHNRRGKHLFDYNLAYGLKHDPHQGNIQHYLKKHPIARAATSFLFDIALDPLTYAGVGMVTKPYRFGKAVMHTKDERQLASELEKLGLQSGGVDRPINASEYLEMMGRVSTRRVARGATHGERRRYMRRHTIEGKNAYHNAREEVQQARKKLEILAKVKESGRRRLSRWDAAKATQDRVFDDALDQAGRDQLVHDMAEADAALEAQSIGKALGGAAPPVGHVNIGGEFSQALDDAMQVAELTRLVRAYGKHTNAQKQINRLVGQKKTAHPDYALNLGRVDDAKAEMDEIISKWTFGDEETGSAEIGKILDQMQSLGEADPAIKGLYGQARQLKTQADKAPSEFEQSNKLSAREVKFRKADRAKASILKRLLGHRAEGTDVSELVDNTPTFYKNADGTTEKRMGKQDRLKEIDARKNEIRKQLRSNKGPVVHSTGSDVVDPQKLKNELDRLDRERNGIIVDAINKSEAASRVDIPDEVRTLMEDGASTHDIYRAAVNGEISGEWADLLKSHVEERATDLRNTAIDTKIRRRRDMVNQALTEKSDIRDFPDPIQKMFTQASKGKPLVPKIAGPDGAEITLKDKDALKKLETQADRDKAASSNKAAAEDKTVAHPVTHPVHQYTFERVFQEQHDMSYQSAMDKMQIASGDYVQVQSQKISRAFFKDWVRQHPQSIGPSGFGLILKDEAGKNITYAKFMDDVGEGYTVREARENWAAEVKNWLDTKPEAEINRNLNGVYNKKLSRQRTERKRNRLNEFNVGVPRTDINKMTEPQMMEHLGKGDFTGHFSNDEIKRIHFQARDQAVKDLTDEFEATGSRSLGSVVGDKAYVLGRSRDTESSIDDIKETFIDMMDDNYRQAQEAAKVEVAEATDKVGASTKVQNELQAKYNAKEDAKAKLIESAEKAKDTQEALIKRLEEHMLMSAAAKAERNGVNSIRFTFAGQKFLPDIPTPEFLYKLTSAISDAPMINRASELWAQSFSPSSKLSPELNKARLRMQSHTPELIKQHIRELHRTFGSVKPNARKQAFGAYRKSGKATGPVTNKIQSELESMLPYVNGKTKVGDHYLTAHDINKYLPDEFKFVETKPGSGVHKLQFVEGHDIVKHMRQMGADTDPMKMLWSLRVATEKAQSEIALKNVITGVFGIKRDTRPLDMMSETGKLTEQLHAGHGWVTVSRHLGTDHYFDPQTASEINRLFELLKPGKEQDTLIEVYDKAIHFWKGAVTVYNPGYYSRNGIGEVLMGMFDGLINPYYYKQASKVMMHTRPDETKEALKALDPWQALKKTPPKDAGRKIAVRLKNGHDLTYDEVEVLFSGTGLKSGFVSTEYDHVFPRAGTTRSTMPGRMATGINDKIRAGGEKYEDYFRLSHFLYRLERAPKGLTAEEAADWSAGFVRKYHFDYTDFTPHEKALWMRVFPFYKWTRKAMPLMASMLFTRPGMVNFYPKFAQSASYGMGGSDPMTDKNGVLPNYSGAVPDWMKSLFTYPIGKDKEGNEDYAKLATPAMDIYSMIQNPVSGGIGMLSPGIKMPLEWAQGHPLDPNFTDMKIDDTQSRYQNAMKMTPITSLIEKTIKSQREPDKTDSPLTEPGGKMDEALFSWLTGIGTYENNESRQFQARMDQARRKGK